jgi:hypothetical protein
VAKPQISVGIYWINDFHVGAYCSEAADLEHNDTLGNGFGAAMRFHGHRVAIRRSNTEANPLQWQEATDDQVHGVERVEFAFLATHGATNSIGTDEFYVYFPFHSPDGCHLYSADRPGGVGPIRPLMSLGDGALRWVVMDACRSLQLRQVNDSPAFLKLANPFTTWSRNNAGLNMMFGFTGDSTDSWWSSSRGSDFGWRAGWGDRLADAWVEVAHFTWTEDTPVALAWGATPADARQRLLRDNLLSPMPRLDPADAVAGHYLWWDP